jgi:hypothetical protein
MNLASIIGPAVVAAVISAIVSGIGFLISARTTRAIHSEKLIFDREQAERRATAEITLAEKKIALDRAFAAWKRRTEFAEQVLADFYQAREIVAEARSPGSFGGEGETRQKEDWETEQDTSRLNSYFATAERLINKRKFFAQLHARRYRFQALLGQEAVKPYDDLHKVYASVMVAVRMLVMTYRDRQEGSLPVNRQEWQGMIWDVGAENDPIAMRLNQIVSAIEGICRPVIQTVAQ